MASSGTHARSHSLLLLQKLLNLRDAASPLTLVLDSLEQTAGPLLRELFARAATTSRARVIFVSFATARKPRAAHVLVRAAGRPLEAVRRELVAQYPAVTGAQGKPGNTERAVVVIDSLNNLATTDAGALAAFLSNLLAPAVSLVGVYHTDVPVVLPPASNEYEPAPLTTLCHLATAILRLSSLQQDVERQRARNRALQEPEWGLGEEREGVVVGLRGSAAGDGGRPLVIDMELRRRSGRTVSEKFMLAPARGGAGPGRVSLLADHAMFAAPAGAGDGGADDGGDGPESTFDLGLTQKQRRDREGVVLPYFDAQTDIGAGEGGRILYDMGREDDFDDEEDEI